MFRMFMPVLIPMQDGDGVVEHFDAVWSSTNPLSPTEYISVIDEINVTCKRAYPKWKRRMSLWCVAWCVPVSFLVVCLGGSLIACVSGPLNSYWHQEVLAVALAVAVLIAALSIFLGRWLKPKMKSRMLMTVRRNLIELNERFIDRGINFELHDAHHLDLYFHKSGTREHALRHRMEDLNGNFCCHVGDGHLHHGGDLHYVLVIQFTLGNKNETWIPPPDVLHPRYLRTQTAPSSQPSEPLIATMA